MMQTKQILRGIPRFFVLALLSWCAAAAAQTPAPDAGAGAAPTLAPLANLTWQWDAYVDNVRSVRLLNSNQTLLFSLDGRINARADCNQLLGSYEVRGNEMTIRPGPSTLVGCPPNSAGAEFIGHLAQVVSFAFSTDNQLLLQLANGGRMIFSAQAQ